MYGLEAIEAHNGWAISAVGIIIVFSGLTILSFVISQLHKILKIWDDRGNHFRKINKLWDKKNIPVKNENIKTLSPNFDEKARQFYLLIKRLNDPFSLPGLIEVAERRGLYRPHSTVSEFIKAKIIVPDEKGFFHWKYGKEI